MSAPYTEHIVWARTEDGIDLTGLVIRPSGEARQTPILWIHGFTGSFYEKQAVLIGRLLAQAGYIFLSGNNRGHDVGHSLGWDENGPRLGGASWEHLDEAPHDVAAWMDTAATLGRGDVILLGHSLGARKVVYYQALRQDPRVRGLIAASPGVRMMLDDSELLRQAGEMVGAGRGQDLLPHDPFGGTFPTSAATYHSHLSVVGDVFGLRGEDAPISRVRCPILAFYGTKEPMIGGEKELEAIRRNAVNSPSVETRMIPGADHIYNVTEDEVADLISSWSDALP